jgi:hypothetical protein
MRSVVDSVREWREEDAVDEGVRAGRRDRVESMSGSISSMVSIGRGGASGESRVDVSCWKMRV